MEELDGVSTGLGALDALGGFHISVSQIIAALFFSVVGWYYYKRGRKDIRMQIWITGIALMIYPYFVTGDKLTWVVGFGLWGLAYYLRNHT